VAGGVAERLLGDSVGRAAYRGRRRPPVVVLLAQLDLESGAPLLGDEIRNALEPG
jgi:hypothetical protein